MAVVRLMPLNLLIIRHGAWVLSVRTNFNLLQSLVHCGSDHVMVSGLSPSVPH